MMPMKKLTGNDDGFILVAVLVTLMLLVVIGFSATTTTTVELQIAGNDKVNKRTFYDADGGTELGIRMIEENMSCPDGFSITDPAFNRAVINNIAAPVRPSGIVDFWRNQAAPDPADPSAGDDDGARDFYYPADYTAGNPGSYAATAGQDWAPHTNVTVGGVTQYLTGSAIQMVAGYEGKGKGAAASGSFINFNIIAQRHGERDAVSEVQTVWRHVIGQEGDCNY